MPNQSKVSWLHISDTHHSSPKPTGGKTDEILTHLQEDLDRIKPFLEDSPDFLFFTGDASFGRGRAFGEKIEDQFDAAIDFFEKLRHSFEVPIPKSNIFLVPGNHDINTKYVPEFTHDWIDGKLKNGKIDDLYTILSEGRSNIEFDILFRSLDDYIVFLEKMGVSHLLGNDALLSVNVRNVRGKNVGIAGFNSAWPCGRRKGTEKGRIWMGAEWQFKQAVQAFENVEEEKEAPLDLKIALMHHPPRWLGEKDDKFMERSIQNEFDFLLHGHEHNNWVSKKEDHHHTIIAGASYTHGDPDLDTGYNMVEFDLEKRIGKAFLREFTTIGKTTGRPSTNNDPKTDKNGVRLLDARKPEVIHPAKPDTASINLARKTGPESRGVYGRSADITFLCRLIRDKKIIFVSGLPGMGKTVLISEAKRQLLRGAEENFHSLIIGEHTPAESLREQILETLPVVHDPKRIIMVVIRKAHKIWARVDIIEQLAQLVEQHDKLKIILEGRTESPELPMMKPDIQGQFMVYGLNLENVKEFFAAPFVGRDTGWILKDSDLKKVAPRLGWSDAYKVHTQLMVLLAQLAEAESAHPLDILKDKKNWHKQVNDLEKRLFASLCEQTLDDSDKRMLHRCTLYRHGIPRSHTQELGEDARKSFDILQGRFLVNRAEGREVFLVQESVKLFIGMRLKDKKFKEEVRDLHEEIGRLWLQDASERSHPSPQEVSNALEAIYHLTEAGVDSMKSIIPDKEYLEGLSDRMWKANREMENQNVLKLLIHIDPYNDNYYRYLGQVLAKQEGITSPDVGKNIEKALELDPLSPANLTYIGRYYLAIGSEQKFVDIVENLENGGRELAQKTDDNFMLFYARCLQKLKRMDEMSQVHQERIQAGTLYPDFYNREARILIEKGKKKQAEEILEIALERGCSDDVTLMLKARCR